MIPAVLFNLNFNKTKNQRAGQRDLVKCAWFWVHNPSRPPPGKYLSLSLLLRLSLLVIYFCSLALPLSYFRVVCLFCVSLIAFFVLLLIHSNCTHRSNHLLLISHAKLNHQCSGQVYLVWVHLPRPSSQVNLYLPLCTYPCMFLLSLLAVAYHPILLGLAFSFSIFVRPGNTNNPNKSHHPNDPTDPYNPNNPNNPNDPLTTIIVFILFCK